MASIKGKNTKPELLIWGLLDHRRFKRYPKVYGNPDFGNISRKVVIFVDGCFWHGCPRCYKAPTTNTGYWANKLDRNKANDHKVTEYLLSKDYTVLRFWEHDVIADSSGCSRIAMEALR